MFVSTKLKSSRFSVCLSHIWSLLISHARNLHWYLRLVCLNYSEGYINTADIFTENFSEGSSNSSKLPQFGLNKSNFNIILGSVWQNDLLFKESQVNSPDG